MRQILLDESFNILVVKILLSNIALRARCGRSGWCTRRRRFVPQSVYIRRSLSWRASLFLLSGLFVFIAIGIDVLLLLLGWNNAFSFVSPS
jgi:hypothetical protein